MTMEEFENRWTAYGIAEGSSILEILDSVPQVQPGYQRIEQHFHLDKEQKSIFWKVRDEKVLGE